jgi:hypothetical protein
MGHDGNPSAHCRCFVRLTFTPRRHVLSAAVVHIRSPKIVLAACERAKRRRDWSLQTGVDHRTLRTRARWAIRCGIKQGRGIGVNLVGYTLALIRERRATILAETALDALRRAEIARRTLGERKALRGTEILVVIGEEVVRRQLCDPCWHPQLLVHGMHEGMHE